MKIKFSIFAIVLIIAFILGVFAGKKVSNHEVITKTDTIFTTDTIHSIKYIPKVYTKTEFVSDTVCIEKEVFNTDTVFIVKDYNTSYTYIDTLFKAKQFRLILTDEIFQNKISSRSWEYLNLAPTIINNTTVNTYNTRQLYLGAYINSNTFYPNYSIYYINKKKFIYTLSFEPIDKVYGFGIGYKIF